MLKLEGGVIIPFLAPDEEPLAGPALLDERSAESSFFSNFWVNSNAPPPCLVPATPKLLPVDDITSPLLPLLLPLVLSDYL